MTTRLLAENAALREQVRVLNKLVVSQAERIAAQSELLARSASRPVDGDRRQWECCPVCQGTGSADNRPADEGMFCLACNGSGEQ